MKYFIGAAGFMALLIMGGALAVYAITGLIMLAGIVLLVESIGWLKWIFVRIAHLVDIILFVISGYVMFTSGVTVAIGVAVCGVLYSLFYKPILLSSRIKSKTA